MNYKDYINIEIASDYYPMKGCSKMELDNFEIRNKFILPESFRLFYTEINGGYLLNDNLIIQDKEIDWPISAIEKLSDLERVRNEIFLIMKNEDIDISDSMFFLNNMTPFSHNNRNELFCFGISDNNLGQIFGVTTEPIDEYFDKPFPIIKLAENLDDFLQMLTKSD
jgi:hypothetical protein